MKDILSRRDFIKVTAAAATAATAGMHSEASALVNTESGWRWDKGVCRFCGVGCGLQVASKAGRIVAVEGDRANCNSAA